jgi:VWFA-related protein
MWMKNRGLGAAALASAIAVCLASSGPLARPQEQGEREPAAGGFQVSVDVRLSQIEVVVIDRKGRHVRGLPPEAFSIREGRRPVPIVTFDEIDMGGSAEADSEPEAVSTPPIAVPTVSEDAVVQLGPPVSAGRAARARTTGDRWFALLFDGYFNPSALRISKARRAAKAWIEENVRGSDWVGVYQILPELTSVQGFTRNRGSVIDAIDEVRIMPGSSMGQEMVRQRLQQTERWSEEFREAQLRNAARFGAELDRSERDGFYMSVNSLADALSSVEGTKAVVLFSGGFPLTRAIDTAARGGLTTRYKDMIKALQNNGIRVFTVDAGEDATFTDASEAVNLPQLVDGLGLGTEWLDDMQIGAQINSANSHHEVLAVLANETGGRFYKGSNFDTALDNVDEDLSHYYLIGYRPADLLDITRYAKLDVEVDVEGLKVEVIARHGSFREPGALPTATRAAPPVRPGPKIEVRAQPIYHAGPDGRTLVVLPVRLESLRWPESVTQGGAGSYRRVGLETMLSASVSGFVVEDVRRAMALPLSPPFLEAAAAGISLREGVLLSPGRYELELLVDSVDLMQSGRWVSVIDVPRFEPGRFSLTDIALFSPRSRAPVVFDAFIEGQEIPGASKTASVSDPMGDPAGRPALCVEVALAAGDPLLAQVRLLQPPVAREDGSSPLEMDWELIPAGGGKALLPPVKYGRLQLDEEGRFLDVVAQLDSANAPPGSYTLRLTARDLESGSVAREEVELELAER